MKKNLFFYIVVLVSFLPSGMGYSREDNKITVTILYDNYISRDNTKSDWGFSCFIEGTDRTILFDTGRNELTLLSNINRMDIDVSDLDLIVISHNHGDHTGGLDSILRRKSGIPVYFGESFPSSFEKNVTNRGAIPVRVKESIEICKHLFSTGEIQGPVNEQSIIIDTEKGLVIITGCSHPGIINILKKSQKILDKKIHMVFGGFHLLNHSEAQIKEIIQEFKTLGVEKCGATHCTGERAIALFKEAYGENYVSMGVGKILHF
jgi:7,8-dihydropterin-6-yl-methyl-4-(beta-D-ribofuranosyl)aminobenzene 5'-phosphate synthase